MKKRILCSLLIVCSSFSIAACQINPAKKSIKETDTTVEEVSANTIDNSNTTLSMMTQEYIGDNIAEIPYITYDGEQEALAAYGGKNPEIDMINNALNSGIQQTYLSFLDTASEGEWIEIRTYPFTSDRYIQFVMTSATYPRYGSAGEMTSYNFDKQENHYISLSELLEQQNMTEDTLIADVKAAFVPDSPAYSIQEVTPVGFLLQKDNPPVYLLEITIDNTEAEPWTYFYSYAPTGEQFATTTEKLVRLSPDCLFDPASLDHMDPPLAYDTLVIQETAANTQSEVSVVFVE